jgi:hypothetical protein
MFLRVRLCSLARQMPFPHVKCVELSLGWIPRGNACVFLGMASFPQSKCVEHGFS